MLTVKQKLKITSLNKPRLFANHLKLISRNISLNSTWILREKAVKKSVSKSQRLWLWVTLRFISKSRLSSIKKKKNSVSRNQLDLPVLTRLLSSLNLPMKPMKLNMLKIYSLSKPEKTLKISSLLSSITKSCEISIQVP